MKFMVSPTARRRSRLFGYLLIFNWGLLGYLMFAVGSQNRLFFVVCFILGLICFAMSMGQVRARRLAESEPLVVVGDEQLEFRRFTSTTVEKVDYSAVQSLDATNPKYLLLNLGEDESQLVGLAELAPAERRKVIEEVAKRVKT